LIIIAQSLILKQSDTVSCGVGLELVIDPKSCARTSFPRIKKIVEHPYPFPRELIVILELQRNLKCATKKNAIIKILHIAITPGMTNA